MAEKFELNDLDLGKVVGGAMDEQTTAWVERNKETIRARAGAFAGAIDPVIEGLKTGPTLVTLDEIKNYLISFNIDISDLT